MCLFGIWKLYKKNYKDFNEITDFYDSLAPQLQRQLGYAFCELEKIMGLDRPTPEQLAEITPDEICEAARVDKNFEESMSQSLSNR